jgi:hypothetical protein
VRSQINEHVECRASGAANKLGFFMWGRLVVQAAQRTRNTVHRYAALGDRGIESVGAKLVVRPRSREKASVITKWFHLNAVGTRDLERFELHDLRFSVCGQTI